MPKPMKFIDYICQMCAAGHLPDCKDSTIERYDVKARYAKARYVYKDIKDNGARVTKRDNDGNLYTESRWHASTFVLDEPTDAFYVWWDI